MRLTLHAVGIGLTLVLATTSCSGDDSDPETKPSATPSTPSTSPSPNASPASSGECTVKRHHPVTVKILDNARAVAVYAGTRAVAPAGRSKGSITLGLFDLTPIRVTSPSGPVSDEITESVLASMSIGGPRELTESSVHQFSLRNDTSRNQMYVLYRGAELRTGRWSAKRCGAPYNDGTEVIRLSGKFSALTPVRRLRVHLCGSEPADRFERAAARVCTQ